MISGPDDENAWQTNEQFAREFLAGLNPVMIACVKVTVLVFIPASKLLDGARDSIGLE